MKALREWDGRWEWEWGRCRGDLGLGRTSVPEQQAILGSILNDALCKFGIRYSMRD